MTKEFRNHVTTFMADNQFDPLLDALRDAEEIRCMGREILENAKKRVSILLDKAPEVLEEQVMQARKELDEYSFEAYMEDFRLYFAIYEYSAIQPALELSDEVVYKNFLCYAAREAITLDNPKVTEKAIEIFEGLTEAMSEAILSIAFDGYIPDEIPEEAAELIRHIAGGGIIIPGDSFMEFLEAMAEDSEEDGK